MEWKNWLLNKVGQTKQQCSLRGPAAHLRTLIHHLGLGAEMIQHLSQRLRHYPPFPHCRRMMQHDAVPMKAPHDCNGDVPLDDLPQLLGKATINEAANWVFS